MFILGYPDYDYQYQDYYSSTANPLGYCAPTMATNTSAKMKM